MENRQFDSLGDYISLAKKTISKFGPKFYNGLSAEMLKNEEAISDVATALMYADWRFDENREGKSGQKKTLYSYRNQCAIWAMKTYVTNKYKKRKDYSMDYDNENDQSMNSMIADHKQKCPLDTIIDEERAELLSDAINCLLDNSMLSAKQKQQIRMYYFEDATLSAIGQKFGVSREAIRQNIKRGLELIRSYDKSNS
jgi:RNA polymerase sigma factor (sigma-70 family)